MSRIITLFCFLTILCFSTVAMATTAPQNYQSNILKADVVKNLNSRKYILGPNDKISINIYNAPELEQKDLRVSPDGKIIIPLLGAFKVSGLTIDEFYDLLKDKYSYYMKNPQISVNLTDVKPFITYVTGAVLNPGSYEINTATNQVPYQNSARPETFIERKTPLLTNILVTAGGVTFDADLEHVQITNDSEGSKYEINLLSLLKNGDLAQDIYLMPGDKVYVPKLPSPLAVNAQKYKQFVSASFAQKSIPIKVYGYVNTPGLIKLDTSEAVTLNAAIAAAGGYSKESAYAPRKVYLSRADENGKLSTITINPSQNDTLVMPNDIIYVPEKYRPLIGKAFDYMTRVIAPANSVASTYNGWATMFNPRRYYLY